MGYNAPPVEHEKATFGNETIVSRYEMPLVVALLERRSDFTDPRDNSTRMAGEMALFVLNPSYRDRQVTLDFGDYFPGLGLRQFKYGEEDPANSSITACEGVISGSIRAYGVRIYHLVELP